jgi:acyl carrier protein
MNTEIYQKIILFISEYLAISISDINMDSTLGEDLSMDSLDLIDIVVNFEDLFQIEIEAENLENIITVKDVYDLIISKLQFTY